MPLATSRVFSFPSQFPIVKYPRHHYHSRDHANNHITHPTRSRSTCISHPTPPKKTNNHNVINYRPQRSAQVNQERRA